MSNILVSAIICGIIIAICFLCTGISVGLVCLKNEDMEQARLSLFRRACLMVVLYFGTSFIITRKILSKTAMEAIIFSLTFQNIPSFAGLLLSCGVLYLIGLAAVPFLKQKALSKKILWGSLAASCIFFILLTFVFHSLPVDMVWGGSHFFILGILAFSFFFVLGLSISGKMPLIALPSTIKYWLVVFVRFPRWIFQRHPYFCYWLLYSICFGIVSVAVYSINIAKEIGFIWQVDAMPQYIPYMRYTNEYIRELFTNLLHGDFTSKMYDFSIGMGDDVRAVIRMRPLEFLGSLFSSESTEELYNILVVARFYMAGLAFTAYCRYRKLPWLNILLASFIYIYSGYTFFFGSKHPVFIVPMIFLPLLLIGMERLIKRDGYLFFSLMVGLSLFINYYFLYITTIALGVYALVRLPQIYKKNRIREFWQMMGRIIGYYLLGCGLASVTFFPTLVRTLNSERVGNSKIPLDSLLIYGKNSGIKLFLSTITAHYKGRRDIYLNFAVLVLPALTLLFIRSLREYFGLKLIIVLEIIGMLVPACGLVMSAFSTITNRWIYIAAFTAAYMVACVADHFHRMTKYQMIGLCLVTLAYGICYRIQSPDKEEVQTAFYSLVSITILLLLMQLLKSISHQETIAILFVCVVISLTIHGRYLYDPAGAGYLDEFISSQEMNKYFNNEEFLHFAKIDDDSFYRCDSITTRDLYENTPISFDYNGTSMYNSVINSSLVNYHKEMNNAGISAVHRIYSMDSRSTMEALASVKYFLAPADCPGCAPYGFTKNDELSYGDFDVYENENPLSIGYTYDHALPRSEYEKLSALEKQQAMLKAVVVDDEKARLLSPVNDTDAGILEGETSMIAKSPTVAIIGDTYFIPVEDRGFTLGYEKKAGYEAYLSIANLETESSRTKIVISADGLSKNLIARNNDKAYSLGRDDYLINLGYSEKDETASVDLSFTADGVYSLGKMKVYYVPIDHFKSDVTALNKESLQDVNVDTNTVTGSITTSENKILAFSIPYSAGWTAYVDGKETELFKTNTAYMGLYLEPGKHEIKLVYRTPGLFAGALVSVISIVLFAGVYIMRKKRAAT